MLAFTIGVLFGEALRDELYGPADDAQTTAATLAPGTTPVPSARRRKWQSYSGLFILLKRKLALPAKRLRQLHSQVVADFAQLIQPLPDST
jgi:hypothetical protein